MIAVDNVGRITSTEFAQMANQRRRAIIPVGSLEQHGDHLPLATDLIIADYVAKKVAERTSSFVFPPIHYGISVEHSPLFNVSLRYSTLIDTIQDISASLSEAGLRRVFYINGHHGNSGAMQYIMHDYHHRVSEKDFGAFSLNYWNVADIEFDHGGETETSLMLAIDHRAVQMNKAHPGAVKQSKSKRAYQTFTNNPCSFPKITENGIWGDPTNARANKGEELLELIISNLSIVIVELDTL
jgi:creatinine amidohydrolase